MTAAPCAGRAIRVAYLIKGLGPGGAERLLVNHLQRHDRRRFVVSVCYVVPVKSHLRTAVEDAGAFVHCLGASRTTDLRWVRRLWNFLDRAEPDVIHVHSPIVAAAARVYVARRRRRGGAPALISTEHNRWPRHDVLTRLANRATYRLDDKQIAVSEDVRESIAPRLRRRVEVLAHGIDVAEIGSLAGEREAVRAELGLAPGDVAVGIVANLRREKRHDLWLRAAAEAARAEPALRFFSIGQGQLADSVHAQAEATGLGERVRLLGYRPDATRVMSGLDVFTLTSDHEGRPVALMEAMAHGLPVVVTAAGGVPEMVTDKQEGYVVACGDGAALARAYVSLARDPDARAALGGRAKLRASAFSADAATRRLEEVYCDLAPRRA